jgi:hypothetical protein
MIKSKVNTSLVRNIKPPEQCIKQTQIVSKAGSHVDIVAGLVGYTARITGQSIGTQLYGETAVWQLVIDGPGNGGCCITSNQNQRIIKWSVEKLTSSQKNESEGVEKMSSKLYFWPPVPFCHLSGNILPMISKNLYSLSVPKKLNSNFCNTQQLCNWSRTIA